MKKSTLLIVLKVLIKAIFMPLIAVYAISKFNIFSYMTFVPEGYVFEAGITLYLAILEAVSELIEMAIESSRASVDVIFYKSISEKSLDNTPTIICDPETGVATLKCSIVLFGNVKRLRKCKLKIALPSWLSSQPRSNNRVLTYKENELTWDFEKLLPKGTKKKQKVEYSCDMSFIRCEESGVAEIVLQPEQIDKCNSLGIAFSVNSFKIQNRGD